MRAFKYFSIFLIIFLSGCSWFKIKQTLPPESTQFVQTGRVLEPTILKRGGRIAIVPFTAGEKVEAGALSDRVSLMIVKGIADVFQQRSNNLFEVVTSENVKDVDFIFEGHLTDLKKASRVNKLLLKGSKIDLGLDGKIITRDDGITVAIFSDYRENTNKEIDHSQLGYIVGQDIARYILNQIFE